MLQGETTRILSSGQSCARPRSQQFHLHLTIQLNIHSSILIEIAYNKIVLQLPFQILSYG